MDVIYRQDGREWIAEDSRGRQIARGQTRGHAEFLAGLAESLEVS